MNNPQLPKHIRKSPSKIIIKKGNKSEKSRDSTSEVKHYKNNEDPIQEQESIRKDRRNTSPIKKNPQTNSRNKFHPEDKNIKINHNK